MTPQEKQEFDAVKAQLEEMKALITAKSVEEAKCEGGKCGCGGAAAAIGDSLKEEEEKAAPASSDAEETPDVLEMRAHIDELAGAVKGLMDQIEDMKSRPGYSVVELTSVPNGKELVGAGTKSQAGGWEYSSMLSAPIPSGAREAVVAEATKRQEKLEKRRAASSRINLRMS